MKRLNILGVETSTWGDGRVLDVFRVVTSEGKPLVESRMLGEIEGELNEILSGRKKWEDVSRYLRSQRRPSLLDKVKPRLLPTRVFVLNDVSDFHTVIEIFTHDRLGLLHEISKVFWDAGLSIQTALISTDVDQVADVFYVKDANGNKIGDKEAREELQRHLLLAAEGTGPTQDQEGKA